MGFAVFGYLRTLSYSASSCAASQVVPVSLAQISSIAGDAFRQLTDERVALLVTDLLRYRPAVAPLRTVPQCWWQK